MKYFASTTGIFLFLLVLPARAGTDPGDGMYFSHGDWEVACDNTHTCRAAGYQPDGEEHTVSVLLTRHAGTGQAVAGRLMLGDYGDDQEPLLAGLPDPVALAMTIDGESLGSVSVAKKTLIAEFSLEQVQALVASLSRHSRIEFSAGAAGWHLSDAGASAVLLKMDDYQGRTGTRGALVRKGVRSEAGVKPARPAPVIHKAHVLDRGLGPATMFAPGELAVLRKALAADRDADCQASPEAGDPSSLQAARLDGHRVLVSMLCWQAAYNEGYGFWVVDDKAPFRPVLVTAKGSSYEDGDIDASQKGRGLADCGSTDEWVWDGHRFVHAASRRWGLCKLLAPGGAWSLPTLVSDVQ